MGYPYDADNYQDDTRVTMTDSVRNLEPKMKLMYLALGLGGETGEVLEKIKKIVRDKDGHISSEDHALLIKELGDICWYIARFADELQSGMMLILRTNRDKLLDRKVRGTLHGEGDNR